MKMLKVCKNVCGLMEEWELNWWWVILACMMNFSWKIYIWNMLCKNGSENFWLIQKLRWKEIYSKLFRELKLANNLIKHDIISNETWISSEQPRNPVR